MLAACNKEPSEKPVAGLITMNTMAPEVSLSVTIPLESEDDFTIDWGDGTKSNMNDARFKEESTYFGTLSLGFAHNYLLASTYKITITGNILSLFCANNQLTSLDVTGATRLKALECDFNQLATLDVSRNTELEALVCGVNQLTELDVSRNSELERLICIENQLTTLDVSRNTVLRYLHCDNNQLTTLDVSYLTELIFLHCRYNQLTTFSLNDLFRTLSQHNEISTSSTKAGPIPKDYSVYIHGNPGTSDCDVDIAKENGWYVNL